MEEVFKNVGDFIDYLSKFDRDRKLVIDIDEDLQDLPVSCVNYLDNSFSNSPVSINVDAIIGKRE